jgi:hypothetical protein
MAKLELTLRNIIKDINFNDDELNYQCRCDNCGKENFTEYRFKCLICKDYDLCGRCFEERKLNKEHEICHPMHRFGFYQIDFLSIIFLLINLFYRCTLRSFWT